MPTPKRSVRVSDALWDAVGERAEACGMTRSELLRLALGFLVNLELVVGEVAPAGYERSEL